MHDVMRFWFDRGVDGFRIDVLWHMVKAADFLDNPPNPNYQPAMGDMFRVLQHHSWKNAMSRRQGETPVCSPLSSNRKATLLNPSRNLMRFMWAPCRACIDSILPWIELPGAGHRHGERPQRMQHSDGAGMFSQHFG
jgi:hypothetical protein